jgi:hypothetical protein
MSNRTALAAAGVVVIAAGCLNLGFLVSSACGGQPRPIIATQPVIVSDKAFAPDDPAVAKTPAVATALTATLVNANFSNTPAMQAFADMAKQTGYKIELYQGGGGPNRFGNVTYKASAQPFWAVMREICTRGNVGLYMWGDEDHDRIPILPSNYGDQNMFKASASVMGPYITIVTYLERVNTVNLAHPEKTERHIQIQMVTFAEPKAVPVQASWEASIDEAVDDNGNSMMPTAENRNNRNMQGSRGVSWQSNTNLPYPETNPGKRIAKLRGHSTAVVQLGSEPIDVPDPLKAAEMTKTVGGQRFTFKSLKKVDGQEGQYELSVVFYRDGKDPETFNQMWQMTPNLKLTDAKGEVFRFGGGGGNGDGEKITRQFRFYNRNGGRNAAPAAEPAKLVITVPSATQQVNVPFELADLPLP